MLSNPILLQLRNKNLEAWANEATKDCQGLDMTPPGLSLNNYTVSLPVELPSDTIITYAVSAWMNEMNLPAGQSVSSAQQNFVNVRANDFLPITKERCSVVGV
ncbi:hypothetical protein GCK32_021719, partial [Trichostrongylus colubriformis]